MDSTAELVLENQHSQIMTAQSIIFKIANDTIQNQHSFIQNQRILVNNQVLLSEMISNLNVTILVTSFYVSFILVCLFYRLDASERLNQPQPLIETPDADDSYKELA
jgi:predicted DCC family thiol-disulfide oxidoreductase YuxK